jgi:mRNA interferase RelE/StbE
MYQVVISNKAEKALLKLTSTVYARMVSALNKLALDPRPAGCKKLKGREAWRIRVGDYRAIYEIEDGKLIVRIISVGHRKDIYE